MPDSNILWSVPGLPLAIKVLALLSSVLSCKDNERQHCSTIMPVVWATYIWQRIMSTPVAWEQVALANRCGGISITANILVR
jgi:hypothetical protein